MLIYLEAFELQMNDLIYSMKCAGYHVNISDSICEDMEMEILISGNDGKMFDVYSTIINDFGKNIEDSYIKLAKHTIYDNCVNNKYAPQYKLLSSLLDFKINKEYVGDNDIIELINDIELNDKYYDKTYI